MAEITKPLTDLTKKGKPFIWTKECNNTFNTLKVRFKEEPILKMYKFALPTRIVVDASNVTTSGVLEQKQTEDNRWHPVTF
jgi:hypothetical protein